MSKREKTALVSPEFHRLLDSKELADHLHVPLSWVRNHARSGELPCVKLGHYVRFRLEQVQQYLAERE